MADDNDKSIYDELHEEIENEEQTSETEGKKPVPEGNAGSDEGEEEPRLVTAEDAKRLGLSNTLIGKPYQETVESVMVNLSKWNTQLSQTVKELQKEFGEIKVKIGTKQKEEIAEEAEEAEDKLPPMPDPISQADEFQKWLNLRDEMIKKAILKEIKDQIKEVDSRDTVTKLQNEKDEAALIDSVEAQAQKIYGDEYKPEILDLIINEYDTYLESLEEEDMKQLQSIYKNSPEKLAKAIISFHKASLYDKTKESKTNADKSKKKEEENHDEKVKKLKDKNKSFTNSSSSAREKFEEKDPDSPYSQLIEEGERHLGEEVE